MKFARELSIRAEALRSQTGERPARTRPFPGLGTRLCPVISSARDSFGAAGLVRDVLLPSELFFFMNDITSHGRNCAKRIGRRLKTVKLRNARRIDMNQSRAKRPREAGGTEPRRTRERNGVQYPARAKESSRLPRCNERRRGGIRASRGLA